jgi:ribosomal protein RSM22 (predicted rRNA methylase)
MFANLPNSINKAITDLLLPHENKEWHIAAEQLHNLYTAREKKNGKYINNYLDVLAYLRLRVPSTYAQIFGSLAQVREMIPFWKPKSILDIGSGPGTGVWAAKEIWPSIKIATCVDRENYFISVGSEIIKKAGIEVETTWEQEDITRMKDGKTQFDLVIVANILNELTDAQQKTLLDQLQKCFSGLIVIIEPGTSYGVGIIQKITPFIQKGNLLAPYINNTFVADTINWIHFSQRFKRPEFLRQTRQQMRTSSLMASDWEESKYAYTAIGNIFREEKIWGRTIGSVKRHRGFLEFTVLTQAGISKIKVLKRNKKEYTFAKNLRWGQIIRDSKEVIC